MTDSDTETDGQSRTVPISFVAKMLNTTISKAQRKFGGKGHLSFEEINDWVEKHASSPAYIFRIEMLRKLEAKLVKDASKPETRA